MYAILGEDGDLAQPFKALAVRARLMCTTILHRSTSLNRHKKHHVTPRVKKAATTCPL